MGKLVAINITGAGTITQNYDGANKHRTVIEDEVFVGSTRSWRTGQRRSRRDARCGTTPLADALAGELTSCRAPDTDLHRGLETPGQTEEGS